MESSPLRGGGSGVNAAPTSNEGLPQRHLLALRGISKSFPGVTALSDVDFDVREGEVHVLLGENGAGKSTLIKIIAGALSKDKGDMWLDGVQTDIRTPAAARERGISVIYQELNLVLTLDVCENVFLGRTLVTQHPWGRLLFWKDRNRMKEESVRLFKELGIAIDLNAPTRNLNVAQRQLVEIARALSFDAKVILMDEPTSSLGIEERERLFDIIRALKSRGIGIVYVSHILEEVLRIGDRVTVLRDGKKIGTKPIKDVSIDELIRMMIGRSLRERYPKLSAEVQGAVLQVQGLTKKGVFQDINFTLRRGEILGLAGLIGSRRTELVRCLVGADAIDGGRIYVDGARARFRSPQDAMIRGITLLTEDRKSQGLFGRRTVHDNIMISLLNKPRAASDKGITNFSQFINFDRTRAACETLIADLRIKTPSQHQLVEFLSGGNQQKVLLARSLSTDAKVVILDEPTKGIDAGSKIEIYQVLERLARNGVAIIVVSSELEEVMSICNRLIVMRLGRITGEFRRESATESDIMRCATLG